MWINSRFTNALLSKSYIKSIVSNLRITLIFMIMSAVLEGICGLLLIPVIIHWQTDLQLWLTLFALFTLITIAVQFYAGLKGFLAGGIVMHILTKALIHHLPRAQEYPQNATQLLSGPVSQTMGVPAHLLAPLISAVVTPLTVIIGLMFYNAQLAIILLATGIIIIAMLRFSANRLFILEKQQQHAETNASEQLIGFAHHQSLLRKSGQNAQAMQKLSQVMADQFGTQTHLLSRSLPYHLFFSFAIQLIFIAVLLIGARDVLSGNITPIDWLAIMIVIARFIEPLHQLSHIDQAIRQAKSAFAQITTALATSSFSSPENSELADNNNITISNISYLNQQNEPILTAINTQLAAGKMTAIVGPSGAGKSTLLRLLARLNDPNQGVIYYGNNDIRKLSEQSLAKSRGLLLQDNRLLRGSLRWNLNQGNKDIDDNILLNLMEKLNLTIDSETLDQDVGSQGDRFSGGQKQRLCLARTLLTNPKILFLDEPTASLDNLSTQTVITLLKQLDCTRIIVTHNPQLALQADSILILDNGTLVAQGTAEQLRKTQPWFAHFCQ